MTVHDYHTTWRIGMMHGKTGSHRSWILYIQIMTDILVLADPDLQIRTYRSRDPDLQTKERALLRERRPPALRALHAHALRVPRMHRAREWAGR